MGKNSKRDIVTLQCTECGERNYTTTKNKRNVTGKMELNKYCPRERKHTTHKEIK